MRDSDTLKTLQIVGVWRLHQDDAYPDHEQYPDADDHGDERNFIHRSQRCTGHPGFRERQI